MALRALQRCMHSRQRIVRIDGVIKIDVRPCGGVVARVAGGRKRNGGVIRIGCILEVRLMTAKARRRQCRVVVVHVALSAGNRRVRSGEWKRRVVVVKAGKRPGSGVVTLHAFSGETRRYVRGIIGRSEVFLVAAVAGGGKSFVVVVCMALSAGNGGVRSCQRKCSRAVIETRGFPAACGMAQRTVGGESCRGVVWVCG
jgi:hypothetical protein